MSDKLIATLGGIIGGGLVALVFLFIYFKTGKAHVYRH